MKKTNIGRIVFVDESGPCALPVNYGVAGDGIVFRIEAGSRLRELLKDHVAFEVDHVDPETETGWSVLVRGAAHEVALEQVPALLKEMKATLPRPWAEGTHNTWIEIESREMTGRKLTDIYTTPL